MFARINYVDIRPESFTVVDPVWRDTVAGYDGLIEGYFLRDADSAEGAARSDFALLHLQENNSFFVVENGCSAIPLIQFFSLQ